MTRNSDTSDSATQRVNPKSCSECGSGDIEEIETETTLSGEFIRGFACNDCYAAFKVHYQPVQKETYHEPEVPN